MATDMKSGALSGNYLLGARNREEIYLSLERLWPCFIIFCDGCFYCCYFKQSLQNSGGEPAIYLIFKNNKKQSIGQSISKPNYQEVHYSNTSSFSLPLIGDRTPHPQRKKEKFVITRSVRAFKNLQRLNDPRQYGTEEGTRSFLITNCVRPE